MSSAQVVKSERLAARVTEAQKRLVERAAKAEGTSVADFTVAAAVERAREVLSNRTLLELEPAEWESFCSALDQPPEPMPGLVELLRRPSVFAP
ncbi:MAG: DUF1778 domain-containing protein [Bifidobacteriaceae bacterium]|nr:DUF1778 domain-containing protein [Bifidobacteriaceae bacterium]